MSTFIVNHDGNSVNVKRVKRSSVTPEQISYCFPNGNKKYKNNDETGFIIWSIPPKTTCPFSTPMCRAKCYAVKAWNAYPTVKVARTQNYRATLHATFVEDVVAIILYLANTGKNKKRKKIIVRIHESGDFYSREYYLAWLEIARRVQAVDSRVVFWAYTKSFVYMVGTEIPTNMFIRASVWADTEQEQLDLIELLGLDIYTAMENAKAYCEEHGYNHCRCEDCATCLTPCGEHNGHTVCDIH